MDFRRDRLTCSGCGQVLARRSGAGWALAVGGGIHVVAGSGSIRCACGQTTLLPSPRGTTAARPHYETRTNRRAS
jgi:hypothetical protein